MLGNLIAKKEEKMAAPTRVLDENAIMSTVDSLLKNELHIIEGEERFALWKKLYDNGTVKGTVRKLSEVYSRTLHSAKTFASFTFAYFSSVRTVFEHTDMSSVKDATESDVHALFNFLGHSVFVYGQGVESEKPRTETTTTRHQPQAQPGASSSETSTTVVPETRRGLLSLGGGCMGEMWKVSKRRKVNQMLTADQRDRAQQMYDLVFAMKMTADEKKAPDVPIGLKIRDRTGGLFIPKLAYLPFLRETNCIVTRFANPESYKRFGSGMLKVCMAEVTNTLSLWETFDACCEEANPDISPGQRRMFFDEWLRKLTHARLGEFISARTLQQAEKAGKRSKGGQTLRDELFALTKKKPTRSEGKGLSAGKGPTKGKGPGAKKGKQICPKRQSTETVSERRESVDSVSSLASAPTKRRRVRSRLLDDFVE